MWAIGRVVMVSAGLVGAACLLARVEAVQAGTDHGPPSADPAALRHAHLSFYNGRYLEAAAEALAVRADQPDDLAGYELRTSALLFQLKQTLASRSKLDKREALKQCDLCAQWTATFLSDTEHGQVLARTRLATSPSDEPALFFLAKLDLNYVWLQLELLGRKKGWNEYWEARRSLDALLTQDPQHVRGRVARAWIDYIVDTKLPRATRWILGGGNRRRALLAMRQAATTDAEFFVRTEAAFALWDMEVRERNIPQAIAVARGLVLDYPENRDLTGFLAVHDPALRDPPPDTAK